MVLRRDLIRLCGYPLVLAMAGAPALAGSGRWTEWRRRFVRDGRVVDALQSGISHSEGQAYALLAAQAFGDEEAFRAIEGWTAHHLAVRDDSLMAWKWVPSAEANVADWHNATDGDLFRAWALLRASRDSGWTGFADLAVRIARDIADLCLAPDPRAPDELLLLPGAESRRDTNRVLFNASYIMPRALRELGEASSDPRLVRAADHGETVLVELAATGLVPNWVDVTTGGFAPPAEHAFRWGYDALRVPLYLSWSGRRGHPAVALSRDLARSARREGFVAVEVAPDRTVLHESDSPGYLAIPALTECLRIDRLETAVPQPYYPAILDLFSEIAFREGGCQV